VIGVLLLLALFSCKKDPYELGIDLLPPSDTLHVSVTDTCTVEAFSVLQDSARTDNSTKLILGSIMDPMFGKTTASFYTQVRLSSDAVSFGTDPVLDSLVLVLYYNAWYGDTTTTQNIKVYEISQYLESNQSYWSNQQMESYPNLLADLTFTPHPTDSVKVNGDNDAPQLRINMNQFGNYLGNKILYAPASVLETSAKFVYFMKGLHVETTPLNTKGALLDFTASNSISKLVIYYHNTDQGDSLSYEMPVDDNSIRFNHFDHNQYLDASEEVKRQILNHDSLLGSNQLFLQTTGGIKIKVKFPYLKDFGKGKIVAINDALLVFYANETDTTLSPPPQLTMVRQDSIGRIAYLIDENEGSGYFGGAYDSVSHSYYFRITQHIQKVIQNAYSNSYDLFMLTSDPAKPSVTPYRVRLNGTNPAIPGSLDTRFRLKLIYTRLL